MKTPVVVDIETVGTPFDGKVVTVAWKVLGQEVQFFVPGHTTREDAWPDELLEMIADPERPFASFTKYDPRFLRLSGMDVSGPYWDIQVMCWRDNENQSLSLESCAARYLGVKMDKRIKRRSGRVLFECDDATLVPIDEAPLVQLERYNIADTDTEAQLMEYMLERLNYGEWWDHFMAEDVPFTEALLNMECAGLPLDIDMTEQFAAELEDRHAAMAAQLYDEAQLPPSFNVNSNDHMAAYLYSKVFELKDALVYDSETVAMLKDCSRGNHNDCDPGPACDYPTPAMRHVTDLLPAGFTVTSVGRLQVQGFWTLRGRGLKATVKTDGGKWSVSKPTLKGNYGTAADPWVQQLLEYRAVDKLLTTYLRKFPDVAVEGRIYGRFNQTGTKTGRLSSSDPNLQNIPSHGDLGPRVRDLFRGNLVVADYSQLEPRLMAHFSQDPRMVAIYEEGGAGDIYAAMAEGIFGADWTKEHRNICKVLVLAMGYGAGDKKVGLILTVNGTPTSADTGAAYVRELRGLYHVFFEWRESIIKRVKETGFVTTIGGSHRRLKAQFVDRRNWKNVGYGERQAVNAIIQGSAADVVRRTMVACGTDVSLADLRLLAQIHDELIWEGHASQEQLDRIKYHGELGHGYKLRVPLGFDPVAGASWHEGKEPLVLELPDELADDDATLDFEEV